MLLLVTIGLVVIAFVLLVIGFVDHSLGLIYASIACSVLAALILIVVSRLGRRRALRLSPAGVTPGFGDLFAEAVARESGSPVGDPLGASTLSPLGDPSSGSSGGGLSEPEVGAGADHDDRSDEGAFDNDELEEGLVRGEGGEEAEEDDYVFPIEDYDQLRVGEIIPLLVQLDPDELADVRAWELEGRARVSIVRRIDSLLGANRIDPAEAPGVRPAPEAEESPSPDASVPSPLADEHPFPIAQYDSLRVVDILPLLDGLTPSQLAAVEARERAGAGRTTVLNRLQRLLR